VRIILIVASLFAMVAQSAAQEASVATWWGVVMSSYADLDSPAAADLKRLTAYAGKLTPDPLESRQMVEALSAHGEDFWRGYMLGAAEGDFSNLLNKSIPAGASADDYTARMKEIAEIEYLSRNCALIGK
jgi:hypothetical protein